jgi:hypothetical protein
MPTRRQFVVRFVGLTITLPMLLGFSQCKSENSALTALRNILLKLEVGLKTMMGMGLINDVIQAAAKYLEEVATFVNKAAEILEDTAISSVERAAKIVNAGTQIALPHFEDPRVQSALLAVQSAVAMFLKLFQPPNPAEVKLNDTTKNALHQIEQEATNDGRDVEKWASSSHPEPTEEQKPEPKKPGGKH